MNRGRHDKAIVQAIADAGFEGGVRSVRSLSGGCIHEAFHVTLDDPAGPSSVVAKVNIASQANLFHEEANGLDALARTNTVLVPAPHGVTVAGEWAVFLMAYIEPANATGETWLRFGEELAALHNARTGDRYGFDIDNHLGSTFQPNTWTDDWVAFNAEHRLGHQLRLARDRRLLDAAEAKRVQQVIDRLDQFIPRKPHPALLHGDLWSGNALPARDSTGQTRIAVIDPATHIGDGWADIAMMKLFGGFPPVCFERYGACVPAADDVHARIAVYQLYHVLNHVNLFGRGYVSQAMGLVEQLGSESGRR